MEKLINKQKNKRPLGINKGINKSTLKMVLSVLAENFTKELFINRNVFAKYLQTSIAKYIKSYSSLDRVRISFTGLSKTDRYNIHLMSIKGQIESVSHDEYDGSRVMEVSLSKECVEEIFKDYIFPLTVPTPTEVVLKTDKQILFDYLLDFIEKNLADEFKNFLNTI